MKKKILSIILTITMVICLLPMMTLPASAVGSGSGTLRTTTLDLTSATEDTSSVEEGWAWAHGTKTLTLSGVNIQLPSSADDSYGIKLPEASTIALAPGSVNTVKSGDVTSAGGKSYGVYFDCTTNDTINKINGSGKLFVTAGAAPDTSWGIWAGYTSGAVASSLEIDAATVYAVGGAAINSNGIIAGKDMTISNATVTATGGKATYSKGIISFDGNTTITSSTVTATGGNATSENAINRSHGIFSNANVSIQGGTVTATGGTAGTDSMGIMAYSAITVSGGKVIATGGSSGSNSYGMQGNTCSFAGGISIARSGIAGTTSNAVSGSVIYTGTALAAGAIIGNYALIVPTTNALYSNTARTTTLDLTGGVDDSSAAEGWSWAQSTKTLTLSGVNIQIPSSAGDSYGIQLPADAVIVIDAGSVNVVKAGDGEKSYGISGAGGLTINGNGELVAISGSATGPSLFARSFGIKSEGNLTFGASDSPVVTAIGGTSDGNSTGISVKDALTITNGTITATGGTSSSSSYGIMSTGNTLIEDGTTYAAGGTAANSYGIYGRDFCAFNGGTAMAYSGTANWSCAVSADTDNVITFGSPVATAVTLPAGGGISASGGRFIATVAGGPTPATAVRIEVVAPTYTMSASALTAFGSQTVGYAEAPTAQTVTITNTGNRAITLTEPSTTNASTNYTIGALTTTTLAVSDTATFTVQPKTGLAVGTYNETINISGTNSAAASVSAQFTVTAVVPTYGQTVLYPVPTVTAAAYDADASPADYEMSGTAITIKTAKGMAWLTQHSGYWGAAFTITLANDIVVKDFIWSPIGTSSTRPFAGTFDGAGHTVSGVYLNNSSYMQGLFGYNTGTIKNVGVANSEISGGNNVGAIVGQNNSGTVSNCWNSGAVSGQREVGGIVGNNNNPGVTAGGTVRNCWNSGTVSASIINCGGIAGYNGGSTVSNCWNSGTVSAMGTLFGASNAGGIVGANASTGTDSNRTGKVINNYNTGAVSGSGFQVGGVVGSNDTNSIVSYCYYLTGRATNGNGMTQNGIGSGTIGSAGTDSDGTTNAFTGTGASCVLSNTIAYTITDSAGTSGKSIAAGTTLVTALDTWVASETYNTWTMTGSTTYPVFGPLWVNTYTVTYDGNTSTGGTVPTGATAYASGATVTVLGNTGSLVKTNSTFAGWNTAADGNGTDYAPAATFAISANTTLYAKWTAKTAVSITETAQTFTYGGAAKAFAISGTPITNFTITYNQGAGNVTPINAGNYNVVITRPEDATHQSYNITITDGLVISKAVQAAPTVGKTDETISGASDGTITGVDDSMEYKLSSAGSYTEITGAATSVTGLAPGTYFVRYKENANYNAGTDASVTIAAGAAPTYALTITGGGTGATESGSYESSANVPISAGTNAGYNFSGWTSSGSGTFADSSLASTTFTMPASAVTITAGWTAIDYTVTYNGNGNTEGAVPTDGNTYNITNTVTVLGNTGTLVKTGYTFAGWNTAANGSGTSYNGGGTFVMGGSNVILYAKWTVNNDGGGGDSGGSYTPPATNGANIAVNGNAQTAGTVSTTTTNGQTTTTITIDDLKLDKILETTGNNATVTIPSTSGSDVVTGELSGQTVKNMESKEATLEIKTGTATYTLPASQINIDTVSQQLGLQVELKDIKVSVTIAEPSADTVKVVEDTANKGNYQLVVKPVEFTITCTSGDNTVDVRKFNGYVERTIAIPDGIDPSKITTGILLNADGSFSHVPTSIVVINGKYFAKINSLTNSTYSVIYNPITFTDVASHWAKDAVNDMGSRIVVNGVEGGNYEPDRSITRAEFAAIVVRAMGLKKGTTESAFGDVTLTDWFNGYVDTATAYSLITGYDSASFAPNDTITREQAMTILARAMKLTGLSVTLTDSEASALLANYTDADLVSDYAKAGAAACIKTGVVSGTTSSTLSPKDSVTRAEVAAMVQRLLVKSGLI